MGADSTGPLVTGQKALVVIQLSAVFTEELAGAFDEALENLLGDSRWATKAKRIGTIVTNDES